MLFYAPLLCRGWQLGVIVNYLREALPESFGPSVISERALTLLVAWSALLHIAPPAPVRTSSRPALAASATSSPPVDAAIPLPALSLAAQPLLLRGSEDTPLLNNGDLAAPSLPTPPDAAVPPPAPSMTVSRRRSASRASIELKTMSPATESGTATLTTWTAVAAPEMYLMIQACCSRARRGGAVVSVAVGVVIARLTNSMMPLVPPRASLPRSLCFFFKAWSRSVSDFWHLRQLPFLL